MRLIIWGTGNLYQKYKDYLFRFDIIKLCDSNENKQGTIIDNIEVIKPSQLVEYAFDMVVVMSTAIKQICDELKRIGISDKKVILYSQLCLLNNSQICIHHAATEVSFDSWYIQNKSDILLISHGYSYTGVPVALYNMAMVLKKMGYSVLMAAMEGGPLSKELESSGIDYIDDLEMFYQTNNFTSMLSMFKVVVIGTFALYHFVISLDIKEIPVLWWIHETYAQYYVGKEELPQKDNIKFFAGGNRVKKIFNNYYEKVKIKNLQYCIPDSHDAADKNLQNKKENLVVAIIGTIEYRKAQDILLDAIIKMPIKYKSKIKIIIVGKPFKQSISFAEKVKILRNQIENIEWIYEMSQKELDVFYKDIDVLVCPSRDDPMPIVVTQAMMHEKVCIVSEHVGQAEFIEESENGFVIPNEDSSKLMDILMWLLDNREQCALIGKASRKIYEKEFSEEIMERQLSKILREMCN
ncbi:MAG: glycosyltransferase family 4 protein [Hungatella sp.]|nr:glycosyltransferase family 4 protein [Hungatella sp.]